MREITNIRSGDRELSISLCRFHGYIFRGQLLFNHDVATDLNFIANNPILHVVRMYNGFEGATVLSDKKWDNLWSELLLCYLRLCKSYSNIIQ